MNFYAIFDLHLGRYVSPFLASSDQMAMAMVRDFLGQSSIMSQFPKTFDLCRVGSWNEETGITGTDIELICSVAKLILPREGDESND